MTTAQVKSCQIRKNGPTVPARRRWLVDHKDCWEKIDLEKGDIKDLLVLAVHLRSLGFYSEKTREHDIARALFNVLKKLREEILENEKTQVYTRN